MSTPMYPTVNFNDPQTQATLMNAFAQTQTPAHQVAPLPPMNYGYGNFQPQPLQQFQWQPQGSTAGNYISAGLTVLPVFAGMAGQIMQQNNQKEIMEQERENKKEDNAHQIKIINAQADAQVKVLELQIRLAELQAGITPKK